MKGIIFAGGSGSRLSPMTDIVSKQLLPVYDKPMIYYPLSTLMDLGIHEVLIISTMRDLPNIKMLLGDGSRLGMQLSYCVQEKPNGIAECFLIADDFIDESVVLILGDNIFVLSDELSQLRHLTQSENIDKAQILLCSVKDPERFGVADCNEDGDVVRLIEKPKIPTSNLVSVGLYFYPLDVVEKTKKLMPSSRGELEITDLNNLYLKEGRLHAVQMNDKSRWLDAGTPDSLLESSVMIEQEYREHKNPVGYIEVLALRRGLINEEQFESILQKMKVGIPYREHLRSLAAISNMRD